jgi:hypothetical protein
MAIQFIGEGYWNFLLNKSGAQLTKITPQGSYFKKKLYKNHELPLTSFHSLLPGEVLVKI